MGIFFWVEDEVGEEYHRGNLVGIYHIGGVNEMMPINFLDTSVRKTSFRYFLTRIIWKYKCISIIFVVFNHNQKLFKMKKMSIVILTILVIVVSISSCTTTRGGGCPSKSGREMGW